MSAKFNDRYLETDEVEVVRKSKRTKVVLMLLIFVLIAALGVLLYIGYGIFREASAASRTPVKSPTDISESEIVDVQAPHTVEYKKTNIPDLTSLFGMTVSEVEARLGSSFQLTKTDSISGDKNPDIVQLATFTYIPEVTSASQGDINTALAPNQSIYASLNKDGKVIDIYYVCDLRLLDFPQESFEELLDAEDMLMTCLSAAGVDPRDYTYQRPSFEECIVYDNANSENRKVIKQSKIFSGRTTSESIPTAWTLTVIYDFGSGVKSADEFKEATRSINLKLA